MTPRERGINYQQRLAGNAATSIVVRMILFIALPIAGLGWFIATESQSSQPIAPQALLQLAAVVGLWGYFVWWGTGPLRRHRKNVLLGLQIISEAAPFYDAYRSSRLLLSEKPPRTDFEKRELRARHHRLSESIKTQIKGYQHQRELLLSEGKREEADGMAALIYDLEDAEKQLQKELRELEREFTGQTEPVTSVDYELPSLRGRAAIHTQGRAIVGVTLNLPRGDYLLGIYDKEQDTKKTEALSADGAPRELRFPQPITRGEIRITSEDGVIERIPV